MRGILRKCLIAVIYQVAFLGSPRDSKAETPAPPTIDRLERFQVPTKKHPSNEFFATPRVTHLRISLSEEKIRELSENPRQYVSAVLHEDNTTTYKRVSIKLKGAAGSFQSINDRPAFTLNMNRLAKKQRFHGLDKFHLNNSVQDQSYLNEWLCASLCAELGLPAPRVSHARVWLNERDLGLYVLKEGFDQEFLSRHFSQSHGNLYDGGFLRDINQDLEKDEGDGPNDHSDIRNLFKACVESPDTERAENISQYLDVPHFLRYMAFELICAHWDGYAAHANNYRLYFDPSDGKAIFLPHGMDQMFRDPGFPLFDHHEAIVTSAINRTPLLRAAYRAEIEKLLPFFASSRQFERIARIEPVLLSAAQDISVDYMRQLTSSIGDLKGLIAEREKNIQEQLTRREPVPLDFGDENFLVLEGWDRFQESQDAIHEDVSVDDRNAFRIAVGPSQQCVASRRKEVLLGSGHYRIEAKLKCTALIPRADGSGTGAGVRISGSQRDHAVTGTTEEWVPATFDFVVTDPQQKVVLVVELRATAGELLIDSDLVLRRVSVPAE